MKAAIYARISDPGKDLDPEKLLAKKRQDTNNQLFPLRELIAGRGWEVYKEYVDEISAVKNRPQFQEMMQDAFLGKFQVILVVKLDRFARSVKDFVLLLEKLESCNVRLIVTSQGIDTKENNAASKFLVNMLAAVAELERGIISERVKDGLARRKREGGRIGRKPVIFDRAKAWELHNKGMSFRGIAKYLGLKKTTLIEGMRNYLRGS